jgi:class 3 adenylate cyclase
MAFETQAGAAVRVRRTAQGGVAGGMSEIHKLVAILVADVFGYSRLAGADEDRTLARLRDASVSSSVFLAKPSGKEALR